MGLDESYLFEIMDTIDKIKGDYSQIETSLWGDLDDWEEARLNFNCLVKAGAKTPLLEPAHNKAKIIHDQTKIALQKIRTHKQEILEEDANVKQQVDEMIKKAVSC